MAVTVVLYIATAVNSLVGLVLVFTGFYLRFGRGFASWMSFAMELNDFLQLQKLDICFGLFTATGIILALLGILSVAGVKRQSKTMLRLYSAISALIILVQLYAGLRAFSYNDELKQIVTEETLDESFRLAEIAFNSSKSYDATAEFWKSTQEEGNSGTQGQPHKGMDKHRNVAADWSINGQLPNQFATQVAGQLEQDKRERQNFHFLCCGVRNYKDWNIDLALKSTGCLKENHDKGCQKATLRRLMDDTLYFGIASLVFLLVEIIASFIAGWYSTVVGRQPTVGPPPEIPFALSYDPKRRSYLY